MIIVVSSSCSITVIVAILYCTLGLQYIRELMGVTLQIFHKTLDYTEWRFSFACLLHGGQTYYEVDYELSFKGD